MTNRSSAEWVFVLAIWDRQTEELRFEHMQVSGVDEQAAYLLGQREATRLGWLPVKEHESANDYVIQIPTAK